MWFSRRKNNNGGVLEELKFKLMDHMLHLYHSRLIEEKHYRSYERLANRIRNIKDMHNFFIALIGLYKDTLKNSNHLSIPLFKGWVEILKGELRHEFISSERLKNREAIVIIENFLKELDDFMDSEDFKPVRILNKIGIPNPHILLIKHFEDIITIAKVTAYSRLIIDKLNRLCNDIQEEIFPYVVTIIKLYGDHSINHRNGEFRFLNFFDILGGDKTSWGNLISILTDRSRYSREWGLTIFEILCDLEWKKSEKGKFLEIADMLRNVNIYSTEETGHAVSDFLKSYSWKSIDENLFRQIIRIMPRIIDLAYINLKFFPESLFDKFVHRLYRAGSYERFFELLQERFDLAKQYFEEVGYTEYTRKIVSENFWNLKLDQAMFNRLNFYKTGTPLIPLGGRFRTNYLIRIITQAAYIAWKRAQDAGIPVEEIIRAYKTKDGRVRVYCKYEGESFERYLRNNPKSGRELMKQKNTIIKKLNKLNIVHGHLHNRNFTVKEENGRLTVKAIDFDQAVSPNP